MAEKAFSVKFFFFTFFFLELMYYPFVLFEMRINSLAIYRTIPKK